MESDLRLCGSAPALKGAGAMPDLFRLTADGGVKSVKGERFENEVDDLEGFVFANPRLLGEGIEGVARQVSTGDGRIDIMAVDKSQEPSRLVIVELKNVSAGVDVLLQALRYASWAKANQDSVRVFLQRRDVSEADVEFDSIRIIVVAPEILSNLVELSQYVVDAFEFSFVEILRFNDKGDRFVVVNQLPPPGPPPAGASPQEEWTWDKYRDRLEWTSQQVELGKVLFNNVQGKFQSKGWPLESVFRKHYIPFKFGGRNVVELLPFWADGGGFYLSFRLPQPPEELSVDVPQDLRGSWSDKHYYVKVTDICFDLDQLDGLFEAAYKNVAGNPLP